MNEFQALLTREAGSGPPRRSGSCSSRNCSQVLTPSVCPGGGSRAPLRTALLALCALHHALFDLGVLGITQDRRIQVSSLYVARSEAGRAIDTLAGRPLLTPRPRQPVVDVIHIDWHQIQVFKRHSVVGG